MARLVAAQTIPAGVRFHAAGTEDPVKDYFERVAKYIPAEIVAAYTAMVNLIDSATSHPHLKETALAAFLFCLILVPIYYYALRIPTDPKKATFAQMAIATVSFIIWAYALGKGFFVYAGWYDSLYSGLALIAYSLLVGLYVPTKPN